MQCSHDGCGKDAYFPHDECYRHRVMSVGLTLRSPAIEGDWHRTADDWRRDSFGTTDEKELAARGIERAT